ncbi:MAG: hypothetical protein SPK98_05005, partial [Synergistales bacterium]|nr:hypothetical protein [Synergistales bacterium]
MKSKKFFLLGVFLLTALLTSLGSPSFAELKVLGISMQETRGPRGLEFTTVGMPDYSKPIEVVPGGRVHVCFIVRGENEVPFSMALMYYRQFAFLPRIRVYDTTQEKLSNLTFHAIGMGGSTGRKFKLQDGQTAFEFPIGPAMRPAVPEQEGPYSGPIGLGIRYRPNYAYVDISVSSSAKNGDEYKFEAIAYPDGGYQRSGFKPEQMTQKFTVKIVEPNTPPTISGDTSITLNQGNIGSFDLTGTNTQRWYCDTTQESLDQAGLDYIRLNPVTDSDGKATKCEVFVQANTEVLSGGSATSEWTIRAANPYGTEASHNLKITVNSTPDTSDTKIVSYLPSQTIEVKQGRTAAVTLTGDDNVRSWYYDNELSADIDNISLSFDKANPKICTALVTANPDARVMTHTAKIYVFNAAGKRGTTPGTLNITVTPDEDHMKPIIDNPEEEVTVVQGGVATVTFTGRYAKSWLASRYGSEYFTSKLSTKLDFSKNPNRCDFQVTADNDSPVGTYDLYLYAINAAGQRSERAKLTVHVVASAEHTPATIDNNETVYVVPGQAAMATFTGKHVRSWTVDQSDVSKYAWIDDIECSYAVNPDRCDMTVITNTGVNADVSEASIKVYAYNAVGKKSYPATLTIIATNPDDFKNPVIDTSESVSVVAGGTAKAVFTGQHIRRWNYDMNFSDDIHGIELNYSTNPNRCEVLVTADAKAKAGTYPVTIYAYNAVGEETSATLTVTITAEEAKYEDPVIDENEEVSVIAGGTAKAVFTGQHIRAWKYGLLPDIVKAVELNYSVNPNRCEVLVTASSTATGSSKVTIYAYNEVGEETSADLTVKITEEATKYEDPVIDENEEVSVIAGGTAKAVFTGQHIRAWKVGNLPDIVKAVELNY